MSKTKTGKEKANITFYMLPFAAFMLYLVSCSDNYDNVHNGDDDNDDDGDDVVGDCDGNDDAMLLITAAANAIGGDGGDVGVVRYF